MEVGSYEQEIKHMESNLGEDGKEISMLEKDIFIKRGQNHLNLTGHKSTNLFSFFISSYC